MSQNYHNWNNIQPGQDTTIDAEAVASKTFMTQVFGWMSGALVVTALAASTFLLFPEFLSLFYKAQGDYISRTPLGWVLMFSPLIFIFLIGFGIQKLSFPLLVAAFFAFSAVMGLSLGYIFIFYDTQAIVLTFCVTSGMFGTMAVMGWITKADLSGFGRILIMGVVGLSIAMIANWFMQSETMYYIISFAGVAIFTGLTAYDVQKLKLLGAQMRDSDTAARMSISGALTLYLDFINLFLFLLRLLGNRK